MEEIITAFGIDQRLILIQLINFGILMAALGYFLYNPILNLLKEREEKIAQGIKDAEAAAVAKAEAATEKAAVLTEAHASAKQIEDRATSSATAKADQVLADAAVQAAAVLKNAQIQGEELQRRLERESEAEVAKLAITAAEKVLRERTT